MCGCNSRIEDYKTLQIENYHYKSLKSSTPQAAPLLPKICLPTKGKKKRHIYHINTFPLTLLPFWPTNLFLVKLKLQCFGHLMWITNSLEERLKAGGEEDNRGWDGWKASPIQCTWVWAGSESWWWTGKPDMGLQPMGLQSRTWLSNGTKLTEIFIKFHLLIFFFWKSCLCYPI